MSRFRPSSLSLLSLAALATASSLTIACGGPPPAAPAGPPPAVPVALLALDTQRVERVGEFVGTIRSLSSTTVQPQAEGFLTRVLVTSGTRVRPGTPMFEIDSTTQRAALASLESQRMARDADATYARQLAERARQLLEVGAISEQEYEQAQSQQQNTEGQLQSIADQIEQQRAELAYYRVVAQTSGVVGDVPVRVGDRVTRTTVLTTIEDNTGLEAYIDVPVQLAPGLRPGLPVRILDVGETVIETQISFVAPSVTDATQSVLVKAPVRAPGDTLRADQFVRTQIVWGSEDGLLLPIMAVQRIGNQSFVFVAETSAGGLVAKQRPVTLGPIVGEAYRVLGGLEAGDRLVLAGTQKIGDGAPIQELPSGPPQGSPAGGAAGGGGA